MDRYYYIVFLIFSCAVGLCVGSFLNVVIYRVPNHMSVAFPASHCPKCKYKLKWYDNIPVLSYIMLGGKCRSCKSHISFRYTTVEILNMLMWLACVLIFYNTGIIYSVLAMLTCSVLICVFFIDLENMIIPDRFHIILLCLGITGFFFDTSPFAGIKHPFSNLLGGVVGFAVFWGIAVIGEKILGKEAMGGGDIKLCGVMGLFLGWQRFLLSILLASVSACVVIFISKIKSSEEGREYPFAPFLSTGFAVALLFGNSLINWYISLLV